MNRPRLLLLLALLSPLLVFWQRGLNEPDEGRYAVNGAGEHQIFRDRADAFARARDLAGTEARLAAIRSGADHPVVELSDHIDMPVIEGLEKLVEARFIATASGRPRIAAG